MTMTGPANLPLPPPPAGPTSVVEAYLGRSGMFTPGVEDPRRYDEMTGRDGALLPGWAELAAEIDAVGEVGLAALAGDRKSVV